MQQKTFVEKITMWVGSVPSLLLHTTLFVGCFVLAILGDVSWDVMLLLLTTIVSLEAIYLSIFIQMTVNRHAQELAEVSEDVDEIQEDIDEIQEDVEEITHDVDEIQKDVDEIQEDVEEISDEDESTEHRQATALEQLTQDVRRLLTDLEQMKRG